MHQSRRGSIITNYFKGFSGFCVAGGLGEDAV